MHTLVLECVCVCVCVRGHSEDDGLQNPGGWLAASLANHRPQFPRSEENQETFYIENTFKLKTSNAFGHATSDSPDAAVISC